MVLLNLPPYTIEVKPHHVFAAGPGSRDKCLNVQQFASLASAQQQVEAWLTRPALPTQFTG